jgi:hypothetical protein
MPVAMYRYRYTWTGWLGQPGYTNFFALTDATPQQLADDSHQFFLTALGGGGAITMLPENLKITGDAYVSELADDSGDEQVQLQVTIPPVVSGLGVSAYAAPSGACVTWNTNKFLSGRRVRGRTFLVPLSGLAYEPNGTLSDVFLTNLRLAAVNYISSPTAPCVWHRPTTKGGVDGAAFAIITSVVGDRSAVLRSRRD